MSAAGTQPVPASRHLWASAVALAIVALALLAGTHASVQLLDQYIHALAPREFAFKSQAMAMQRAAFNQPDLLPLYGSSELVWAIPDKASLFFANYPSDFEVFPVGKAGTTSLIILQKLATIGPEVRGKKLAISISPGWFFTEQLHPRYYEGNFSHMQASELAFSSRLSPELKRDAARRMLEFPHALAKSPALQFALERLASGRLADRCVLALLAPFGKLQSVIHRAQDACASGLYVFYHRGLLAKVVPRQPSDLDWDALLENVAQSSPRSKVVKNEAPEPGWGFPERGGDAAFLRTLARANEWSDLELLLRGLRELGAEPLLLSMPINGAYFDRLGISHPARDAYVQRLRALAEEYGMPLLDFEEHEDDPRFLIDHHDHLSVEGWMYFNKALDDFFHGRVARSARAAGA